MKKPRILIIFGTRPEAIKLAPVIKVLESHKEIETRICVTAQHRQMLDQILELFKIIPDFDLNLMRPEQNLTDITNGILKGLRRVFRQAKPDWVLVQGDSTSAFASSLAAFYEKIPVAHVEAGLRTGDNFSPWPEEINRRLTGAIASLHFTPTDKAKENLKREGVSEENIYVTGNTVIDALLEIVERIRYDKRLNKTLTSKFSFLNPNKRLILVTGHRRENFGDGFKSICSALKILSQRSDVEIVYPVHLNSNVQKPVYQILGNCRNMRLIKPLDYLSFVYLIERSYLILTDSGGMQEEAPLLGKPILVMREVTERPEVVEAGTAILVGTDPGYILNQTERLLCDPSLYNKMARPHSPYGDGNSAKKIVEELLKRI